MYLSPTEAIKQYKVSKPTLYADMKNGKLSFDLCARKRRRIMVAELERIYEQREGSGPSWASSTNVQNGKVFASQPNDVETAVLQEQLKQIKEQVSSKNDEIEYLRNALERSQETNNKMLLLEDKSGAGGFEKSIAGLEARLSNQENAAKIQQEYTDKLEQHRRILKRKLKEEKEKPILKRLFGG